MSTQGCFRFGRLVSAMFCIALFMTLLGCATSTLRGGAVGGDDARASIVEESVTVSTAALHQYEDSQDAQVETASPSEEGKPSEEDILELLNSEYLLGANDVLGFRMLNDTSLSGPVTVRFDGYISLPLIPDVRVMGTTRDEATERVREAYLEEFLEPRISLTVVESRSKLFHVMGDLSAPGDYPYLRQITLLDAINAAGGLRVNTAGGDSSAVSQGILTKAFLIRHIHGEREVYEYDLRGFHESGNHASDAPVFPGDVVYVPEAVSLVYLLGEVREPGVVQMHEGMTLLQLLAQGGGIAELAGRMRHVVLMRQADEENTRVELVNVRRILKTGVDVLLKPGDIVYVPRKLIVRLGEFVQQYTGTVSPILDLYREAYESYYTRERYERLYGSDIATSPGVLPVEQILLDIASIRAEL